MVKSVFGLMFRVVRRVLAWTIWAMFFISAMACLFAPAELRSQIPIFVPVFAIVLCILGIVYHIVHKRRS